MPLQIYPIQHSALIMTQSHFSIPELRLVLTEALILHEHADEKRVARLEARLRADGYLKNPPIVAPIPGTDQYVVLDGANRTSAVRRTGYPHILVQIVDYKSNQVQLNTWNHLVTGRAPATFLSEIRSVEGLVVEPASSSEARARLKARSIVAYVVTPSPSGEIGSTISSVNGLLSNANHTAHTSTGLLNAMVDTYKSDPSVVIHRVNTDDLDELGDYYDNVSGLVVFPPYTPDDILTLAGAGTKVPTGITRHVISPRALRVNVPIALLSSDESLEAKNAWWHEQTKRKLAANEIRLYQEATYLFDE
ncbi:MAG TPA: ParB N-terminal domain-containing protein [Chloroflexia bacterium]|nr:ParB N-terminal domain-containing protein [Chloroflexia bacterium]